jgi:hypothetical protein
MTDWQTIAREHNKEVAGNGRYPLDPKYIDEFITSKARDSEGWAIAYALLQVSEAITGAANQIGGVDDFTGIMRIGATLQGIVNVMKRNNGEGK